jgi:hypothetical protein
MHYYAILAIVLAVISSTARASGTTPPPATAPKEATYKDQLEFFRQALKPPASILKKGYKDADGPAEAAANPACDHLAVAQLSEQCRKSLEAAVKSYAAHYADKCLDDADKSNKEKYGKMVSLYVKLGSGVAKSLEEFARYLWGVVIIAAVLIVVLVVAAVVMVSGRGGEEGGEKAKAAVV